MLLGKDISGKYGSKNLVTFAGVEAGVHHLIGKPEGARNKWNDGKLGSEDLLVLDFENIKTKHTKVFTRQCTNENKV